MECAACGKPLDRPQPPTCTRCQAAVYCDSTCQKADWPVHKVGCAESLSEEQSAKQLVTLFKRAPYLSFLPRLERGKTDVAKFTKDLAVKYSGEFCLSTSFDKDWLAELMYNGYLTMSDVNGISERIYFVLPKLHAHRCLVDFDKIPLPHKNVIKRSAKYELSVDRAFMKVCAGIVKRHGENWFYPRLVKAFNEMNRATSLFNGSVRVHSFELWQDGNLVAGECGYTVGASYTSLSGFTLERDGSGTVQMFAMSQLLQRHGFVLWDLGMPLPYKLEEFGGEQIPRLAFLARLAAVRDIKTTPLLCKQLMPAKLVKPDKVHESKRSQDG